MTNPDLFRHRLQLLIDRSGLKQAGFARATGIDRSTLSQLLSGDGQRLPRAETLIAIATAYHVSVDWLLGLSQQEEIGSEIIGTMLQVESHARAPVGVHVLSWLQEAEGYRIKQVPEGFSDFLKTDEILRFEYQGALGALGPDPLEAVRARLALLRRSDSDLEICASLQAFTMMAEGQGKWHGLSLAARRAQLSHMIGLYDELYPRVKIYLYTLTETYANPFTIYGPRRVTLFLGTSFLILNAADHVRLFGRRFDELIKLAVVQPHEFTQTMKDLSADIV